MCNSRSVSCCLATAGGNLDVKLSVASGYDQLSGRTGTLMYMAPEVYKQVGEQLGWAG
jgi:hypothetical protein